MIGAFFSGLIGLVVLIVLGVILYNLPWYVWAGIALLGIGYYADQEEKKKRAAEADGPKPTPAPHPTPAPPVLSSESTPPPQAKPAENTGPILSAADIAEIEAVRKKSLAAMKQAAKARERDMKSRGEVKATPLMYAGSEPPAMKPAPKAQAEKKPPPQWEKLFPPSKGIGYMVSTGDTAARDGAAFETITFDYVDAQGERSHRTVDVTAVDDEYLEGFCHKAQAERTFVIGRIRGKVMVDDTAEVMAPKKWAAAARRNPHNGVVTMGGYTPKRYRPNEPVDDLDEILFTGFPAAKRAELEALAEGAGMRVVKTVTIDLMYLCIGPNAGPSKMAKADEVGAALIDEAQFLSLI